MINRRTTPQHHKTRSAFVGTHIVFVKSSHDGRQIIVEELPSPDTRGHGNVGGEGVDVDVADKRGEEIRRGKIR